MGIKLPKRGDVVEVVLSIDDSLDMTPEEIKEYQKTYNPDVLKFKSGLEPTIFVLSKVLTYDQDSKVVSKQYKMSGGEASFDYSSTRDRVRMALVDIKNPSYETEENKIIFRKDSDGGCSKDIIERLAAANVVEELLAALSVKPTATDVELKKS